MKKFDVELRIDFDVLEQGRYYRATWKQIKTGKYPLRIGLWLGGAYFGFFDGTATDNGSGSIATSFFFTDESKNKSDIPEERVKKFIHTFLTRTYYRAC